MHNAACSPRSDLGSVSAPSGLRPLRGCAAVSRPGWFFECQHEPPLSMPGPVSLSDQRSLLSLFRLSGSGEASLCSISVLSNNHLSALGGNPSSECWTASSSLATAGSRGPCEKKPLELKA